MEELEQSSCICGYYTYSSVWDVLIGEQAVYMRKPLNESDRYYFVLKIFCVINFHGLRQPQKLFNDELFPDYDIQNTHIRVVCILYCSHLN